METSATKKSEPTNYQTPDSTPPKKESWLFIFLKAQFSAFIGGISDFTAMILLTEYAHIFYAFSIYISGSFGAVINYSVNRYWTFKSTNEKKRYQVSKFIVVVFGSITLKSTGTYLLTEKFKLDYRLSRLMVDAVVSQCFNFVLQKYWVFRKK